MASAAITAALSAAARRGVRVTVVMTDQTDWHAAFATLRKAGAVVDVYAPDAALYIHAKTVVSDVGMSEARAYVGSQNFSTASLDHNRELGIITSDPALVAGLARVVTADAAGAHSLS
jgi:cardiolipin synthase